MSDPHNKDTAAAENADVERNEAAATDSKDTPPHSSGDATPNQSTATKAKKQRPGKEPRKQKRRRGNGLSIFMALLLGFTVVWAGAGVYLLWLEMQTLRSDLTFTNQKVVDTADNVANVRSETASNIDDVRAEGETLATQMSSLDGTVQEAQAAMAAGVAEVQDKQKFLEESFVDLRDSLKRDTDAWIAAEAAYLVKIAVDRLNLERDVRTAISALETADQRLKALGDPDLFDTRRKLADDAVALRTTDLPDLTSTALALSAMIDRVERLPLPSDTGPASAKAAPAEGSTPAEEGAAAAGEEKSGWQQALDDAMKELKSLVVIKRKDANEPPLLPPTERAFLRQNLRLKLEAAKIALLRRDTRLFRDSVNTASQWIKTYFDAQAPATLSTLEALNRYAGMELNPPLPDVSGSLQVLNEWLARRGGTTTGGTQP